MNVDIKIGACIGHNSKSKGAFSDRLDQTEFDYNTRIANLVKEQLPNNVEVFNRYKANGYGEEIDELASRVNNKEFDIVFELHFNQYTPDVHGCEALYYHKSAKGKKYAESFCQAIVNEYGSDNRGAKTLSLNSQNGYGFVKKIDAPAVILEPFFGNNEEAVKFINAKRYADTIVKWLKCIK